MPKPRITTVRADQVQIADAVVVATCEYLVLDSQRGPLGQQELTLARSIDGRRVTLTLLAPRELEMVIKSFD